MIRRMMAAAMTAAMALAAPQLAGAQAAPARVQASDYSKEVSWLCLPGRVDACASDQTATVIEADGTMRVDPLIADADRPYDCFYVYPTVSFDETPNSDMVAGPEELRVAAAQTARFRQHCRVYAPLYRQVTLTALRSMMAGGGMAINREMGFGDVVAAWQTYLADHNDGRPVVLIGHSQGSGMLKALLEQLADSPARDRIVSAMLIGTNVERPVSGQGGEIAWMPACTSADQYGCLVSYVTFRDTVPPPAGSRFAMAQRDGNRVVCVNPAALLGHESSQAIFSTEGVGESSRPQAAWVVDQPMPTTPFVKVPGLIYANCTTNDAGASYLQVTVAADPNDPRTDEVTGDVYAGDMRLDDWGLHLIDMPVVMGDLVELSQRQYMAWAAAQE